MPPETPSAGLLASFRDPGGVLVCTDGRVLRFVNAQGEPCLSAFLKTPRARALAESGRIVSTQVLDPAQVRELLADPALCAIYAGTSATSVLEHERIWFPSYAYEWPAEMLHAAAELTLDLGRTLLPGGLGLKDATPFNILFRGPAPIFVDLLSFERREPDDPTWLAYAQFVRTFLIPLLADKHFGLSPRQVFETRRDGIEPEELYRWLSWSQKLRPPFLSLVSIPTWLAARKQSDDASVYARRSAGSPEKAKFILEALLRGLARSLRTLAPAPGRDSVWSDYMAGGNTYTPEQFQVKERFVHDALKEFPPKRVLDVGCNTGHFSAMAARAGTSVIAIDADPVVVGEVWRKARQEQLDILPLAVDLSRPSPAIGWRNRECESFLDRARDRFDMVIMLAVIHHMLVTERIPLEQILSTAAELTSDLLVIEFVGPEDVMFRRLTRGRDALHLDWNDRQFERACSREFEIVRTCPIPGADRKLYLLRRRPRG